MARPEAALQVILVGEARRSCDLRQRLAPPEPPAGEVEATLDDVGVGPQATSHGQRDIDRFAAFGPGQPTPHSAQVPRRMAPAMF